MDSLRKQRKSSLPSGKISRWLRNFDVYGKPVTMTYRGKDKFQTTCGGVISLIVLLFILSVFSYKLRDLVLRNHTQVKKNTLVSISNSYTPPENLSAKNITIAFMLSDFYGSGSFDDPKYGRFKLVQYDIRMTENGRV